MTTLILPASVAPARNPFQGFDPLTALLFERVGYRPYAEQAEILLAPFRYKLVAGGEQAGKSTMAAKVILQDYPRAIREHPNGGKYWLIGPDYKGLRKEFEYIVEDFTKLDLVLESSFSKTQGGRILLKGNIEVVTFSGMNPAKIAGDAPLGIVVCEAAVCSFEVFERVIGRSAPASAWVFMSGTFERGLESWYNNTWRSWKHGAEPDSRSFSLPSWSNLSLYAGGRNDPEILKVERRVPEDFFLERFAGIPVRTRGLVFPEFREDFHVRECVYRPWLPLHLANDPGYGESTESAHALLAIQIWGYQVQVFDEIYLQNKVTSEIIQAAMARQWWNNDEKYLVSDPSYKDTHHAQPSVSETWRKETGLRARGRKVNIQQGIDRLRSAFKVDPSTNGPKIIVTPRARGLLSELGVYTNKFQRNKMKVYSYDIGPDGLPTGRKPHDRYNHSIKALIYWLVWKFGYIDTPKSQKLASAVWNGESYR